VSVSESGTKIGPVLRLSAVERQPGVFASADPVRGGTDRSPAMGHGIGNHIDRLRRRHPK
jgi:hypothetical protein